MWPVCVYVFVYKNKCPVVNMKKKKCFTVFLSLPFELYRLPKIPELFLFPFDGEKEDEKFLCDFFSPKFNYCGLGGVDGDKKKKIGQTRSTFLSLLVIKFNGFFFFTFAVKRNKFRKKLVFHFGKFFWIVRKKN